VDREAYKIRDSDIGREMKIGFVLDDSLDPPDGVQQYVLTISSELKRRGHIVHFLVGQTSREDIENVHSLAKNVKVPFNKNVIRTPFSYDHHALLNLLEKEQFDILHVQMPYSPLFAGKLIELAKRMDIKIVGTFHIAPYSSFEKHSNTLLSLVNSNTLKLFDKIISVSTVAQEFAKKSAGIDSVVIPNAIDIEAFEAAASGGSVGAVGGSGSGGLSSAGADSGAAELPSEQKTILFLGRLVKRKGAEELLLALEYAVKCGLIGKDVKVLIAGAGPMKTALEEYSLNIPLDIEFLGFISEQDKPALLASPNVAVFPSISGESFGIVLLEAIAAGAKVVLAGDNPGYKSTLEGIDCFFNPNDAIEFATSIRRALYDKNYIQKIHLEQKAHIQMYDVKRVTDEIIEVYESVCRDLCL
jgi:phosphatidylinositol alpha-mannosyltransferase